MQPVTQEDNKEAAQQIVKGKKLGKKANATKEEEEEQEKPAAIATEPISDDGQFVYKEYLNMNVHKLHGNMLQPERNKAFEAFRKYVPHATISVLTCSTEKIGPYWLLLMLQQGVWIYLTYIGLYNMTLHQTQR